MAGVFTAHLVFGATIEARDLHLNVLASVGVRESTTERGHPWHRIDFTIGKILLNGCRLQDGRSLLKVNDVAVLPSASYGQFSFGQEALKFPNKDNFIVAFISCSSLPFLNEGSSRTIFYVGTEFHLDRTAPTRWTINFVTWRSRDALASHPLNKLSCLRTIDWYVQNCHGQGRNRKLSILN